MNYDETTMDPAWKTAWLTDLAWSGIIETSAILLVIITDSDVLRAIGGWSMLGVNSTALYHYWAANEVDEQTDLFKMCYTMHAIALGQALDIWINTYMINGATGNFKWFNPLSTA